jgi:hypothetical protein
MGAASYVDGLFSPFENQLHVVLKSNTVEKGQIKNQELVIFRLFRDKNFKEPKAKSFKVEVGDSYEGDFTPLSSLSLMAFMVHQREFDSFMAAAKIVEIMQQDEQALHEREAAWAELQCKCNAIGADKLSDEDKKKLKKARLAVQDAKQLITDHSDKVYDAYEKLMDARKHKFAALVRSECLTAKDHLVDKVVIIKEAFKVDSTGAVTTDRFPEKDNEDDPDDPKAEGFKIKWRWERRVEDSHGMPGKTLKLFHGIRKAHIKHELEDKFGHAEAQFDYMMSNIKLPQGSSIDAMDNMIEQISTLMYLLPSIHDDPNPAYQNGGLSHRAKRNKPFEEGEMTEMLFNSMPNALQKLWKLDNNNQLVPTDRQKLKQDLKILMEKNREQLGYDRQDHKDKGNGGGKGKHGKGKSGDEKSAQPPSTPNASGGGAAGARICKFCKANGERAEAYQRHTTAKCKKYLNIQGKVRDDWVPGKQFRQANAHQKEEGDTPLSSRKKSKKSKKKRKKKSKSRHKKHKKARKSYSSSSSDSSVSSSSSSDSDSS